MVIYCMKKAWGLFLVHMVLATIPGLSLLNFKKIIRNLTTVTKISWNILRKLTSSNIRLLQISKPNKSIDIMFKTEDAADFLINQHIEVRGKPLPFVRKAKQVLKVVVKGVHPEMSSDLLLSELYEYIQHASPVRNSDSQYNRKTFYDDTKQIFVTHLMRHIPRSLKTGNRWCLFYRDQPAPPRRPPHVSTIVETPTSDELP